MFNGDISEINIKKDIERAQDEIIIFGMILWKIIKIDVKWK